jgi:cell division septation protein DedD
VEGPRTHYQVSFTAKQALSLFIGLLAALAVAYFFGLMTGLSGNEAPQAAAVPTPVAEETPAVLAGAGDREMFPIPVTAAPVASGSAPPSTVQVFEDGEGETPVRPTVQAAAAVPSPRAPSAGSFRVQVISVSSREEADAEAKKLSRRGFSARVEPGSGPKGPIYRVRVGPFPSREEAERATQRLAAEGRRDAWIVPPGQ